MLAEWLAEDQPAAGTGSLIIGLLILRYEHHAANDYRKDHRSTSELACIKAALRPLRELYFNTPHLSPTVQAMVRRWSSLCPIVRSIPPVRSS